MLTWNYEGGCVPSGFRVELFSPSSGYPLHSYSMDLDGSSRSWMVGPLEPATTYAWRVTVLDESGPGPVSGIETFFTGPTCTTAERSSYLSPILLRPFDGEVVRSTVHITTSRGGTFDNPAVYMDWDDPTACLPPEGYTVQVSRDPTFRRPELSAGSSYPSSWGPSSTSDFWYWGPGAEWHDCERYYWRVLTGRLNASFTPADEEYYAGVYAQSEAWSFVINTSGVICPLDGLRIITPFPAITLPPEGVPGPGTPMADVNQPANCRSGPGMDYAVLDLIAQGTSLPINGRNQASTWWQVLDANIQRSCWLAWNVADVSGETGAIPVIAVAPPAPTDTPVPGPGAFNCAQYNKDQNACNKSPYCIWDSNRSPNSPCVNKP